MPIEASVSLTTFLVLATILVVLHLTKSRSDQIETTVAR